MRANAKRRLAKIEDAVRTVPLPDALVTNAFEAFRQTGELPHHDGLAAAVIERAVHGDDPEDFMSMGSCAARRGRAVQPREILFREAVHGEGLVRIAARMALTELVAAGADVTDPAWLLHQHVPNAGSLGMGLVGSHVQVEGCPGEAEIAIRMADPG
jgi:hypothetical protein